jgi:DNA replication protein DnaC
VEPIGSVLQRYAGLFEIRELGQELCNGCGVTVRLVEVIPKGSLPGGRFKLGCRCEELRIVREIMAENKRRHTERIRALFDRLSLISPSLKNARFETFRVETDSQRQALAAAKAYVERFGTGPAENMLFVGPYGTGKSHLAVSVVRALIDREYTGIFASVPDLLTKIKATYNRRSDVSEDDVLEALRTVDVLVLDDIGAEYSGNADESWAESKIFEVMNARQGMATVYTTNLNGEQLQAKIGARNFSRMCEGLVVVKLSGRDYRRTKIKF